jgi:hypothetical protein
MKIQHAKHLFNFKRKTWELNKYIQTDRKRIEEEDKKKVAAEKLTEKASQEYVLLYYISELIQDAKRNAIRQNCSLLLCVSARQTGEKERDDTAILMMLLVSLRSRRSEQFLSNRIRIHVSIRSAIVIVNSKLPALCVSIRMYEYCCFGERITWKIMIQHI